MVVGRKKTYLPCFFVRLLSSFNYREHFFLADSLDFRKGNRESSSLLISLLLDGTGKGFGILLRGSIQKVLRQWRGGRFGGLRRLDIALYQARSVHVQFNRSSEPTLVCLDLLFHLNLLLPPLLCIELRAQTTVILSFLTGLMPLTGGPLSFPLCRIDLVTGIFGFPRVR